MSKQITLALLDFNAKQQVAFSAILVLSETSLNNNWKFADKKTANIIFVNSKQVISQKQWDKIQQRYPEAVLVAYSENLEPLNIEWKLLTEETKPPQRSLLIALLNKITIALSQTTKVVKKEIITVNNDSSPIENKGINRAILKEDQKKQPINNTILIAEPPENKHVNDNFFLPEYYFLGIVQKSIQVGEIYHCKTPCNINIYLFPKENSYFCSLNLADLESLFLMYPDEIKIKKILEKDLKQYTKNMKIQSLTDLLWHSAIIASRGRLMKSHDFSEIIHLKYFPDISYINVSTGYLAIAIFMRFNQLGIKMIASYTEQKETDVIDFYNACHMLGLINYNGNLILKSKPASDKLRQLRQSVFKTLQMNITNL